MAQPIDLIRKELLALLRSENAHMSFEDVVADFPLALINAKTGSTPYCAWHFIEHMRIAQWDILEFIRNPKHISPEYPKGYRPRPDKKADEGMWNHSIEQFRSDLAALQEMAADGSTDLFGPIPHAPDYTIFRELLVVADHNAYHVGEVALLRQELNAWPRDKPYLTG
jgi:hypothetical protein